MASIFTINLSLFTPRGYHNWNLLLGDAANRQHWQHIFWLIAKNTLFSRSSKRWVVLNQKLKIIIKLLSETRWEYKLDGVKVMFDEISEVIEKCNKYFKTVS
jgi:hypothetical protein